MKEAQGRNNILGLINLFGIFTILGVLLSFFYVIFQTTVQELWANVLAVFVMGGVLAGIAWLTKRLAKITNNFMSLVVITLAMIIVLYVMWNMWFAVGFDYISYREGVLDSPRGLSNFGAVIAGTRAMITGDYTFTYLLRGFNDRIALYIGDTAVNNVIRGAIWGSETLILVIFPLMAAYATVGLFITELNSWVSERLMNYGFSAFDDYELDQIAAGDIEAIIEKPLEARSGAMSAVAVCYHKGEPTDFIAVYNAAWDKEGVLSKGRHIMTVRLGADKIDELDAGLQAKHYPVLESREQPKPEVPHKAEAARGTKRRKNTAATPITSKSNEPSPTVDTVAPPSGQDYPNKSSNVLPTPVSGQGNADMSIDIPSMPNPAENPAIPPLAGPDTTNGVDTPPEPVPATITD